MNIKQFKKQFDKELQKYVQKKIRASQKIASWERPSNLLSYIDDTIFA